MQLARICELGVIELRGMIDRKELVEHIPGSKNAGEGIIPPLTGIGVGRCCRDEDATGFVYSPRIDIFIFLAPPSFFCRKEKKIKRPCFVTR